MIVWHSRGVVSYSLIWNEEGAWNIVSHCAEPRNRIHRAYLDLVPILTGEGIQSLLLETLLTLRKALVPIILSDTVSSNCCPSSHRESCVYRPFEIKRVSRRDTHFPTAMIAISYLVAGLLC